MPLQSEWRGGVNVKGEGKVGLEEEEGAQKEEREVGEEETSHSVRNKNTI